MARLSELHFFNFTQTNGVEDFLEVVLAPVEDPDDFVVSFYQTDGSVGIEIPLSHPDVLSSVEPETHARKLVLSASRFPVLHVHPQSSGFGGHTGFALTNLNTGDVMDFQDVCAGEKSVLALDGAAAGHISTRHSTKAREALPKVATLHCAKSQHERVDRSLVQTQAIPVAKSKTGCGVACFAAGTRIRTDVGHQLIDTLREGDFVWTRDNGLQPLRWVGKRTLPGTGSYAPIQIAQETFGALKPHLVSPDHLLLLTGWRAELIYGEEEILVPAHALVDDCDVRVSASETVTYFHLAFDAPQIVSGDGVLSQCFHPTSQSSHVAGGGPAPIMFAMFPALATGVPERSKSSAPSSRPSLGPLLTRTH